MSVSAFIEFASIIVSQSPSAASVPSEGTGEPGGWESGDVGPVGDEGAGVGESLNVSQSSSSFLLRESLSMKTDGIIIM